MIFAAKKVGCGLLGELVGDLLDKLVSTMSSRFEGAHEIYVHELKGRIHGGAVGFLRVSQLKALHQRTDVTARNKAVKCDALTFFLFMGSRLRLLR